MDRAAVEGWIRAHVKPVGAIETEHERPWATVLRVPIADGVAWFKAWGARGPMARVLRSLSPLADVG